MVSIIIFVIVCLLAPIFFNPVLGLFGGFKGYIIQFLSPFLHPFTISLLFIVIGIKIFLFFLKFLHRG